MNSINLPQFQLLESHPLVSLSSTGSWYRHTSGLEVFCLQNNDRENLFAVGFSTLPHNSTGVPHIIEHTVLSGSSQYPLRDPFIALIQSSLATFINAMTYGDRTLFPVSSCNHQDLFNLIHVYWDSVFHPLLLKESFHQEGWHYELKKNKKGEEELLCNGIVLNEMKGAYGDLESIYERSIYKYLLPDTPLARDSGGDPECITSLSYEQFLDFYHRHYTLSNAKILFYGNLPLEKKLLFLDSLLQKEKDSSGNYPQPAPRELNPLQPAWHSPRTAAVNFPSDFSAPTAPCCAFALAWNLGHFNDPVDDLAVLLLDFILFGNDSSIMNRTLLESGLCEALLSCGCDDDYQECIFQIGVRGLRSADFAAVEELIFTTLQKLVKDGISPQVIRTAFRQLQIDQYEIDSDHCLNILEDVFATWNYGKCSPFTFLQRDSQFSELKKRLDENSSYMTRLLEKMLLRNPHLLRLKMIPDGSFIQQRETRQEEEMRRRLKEMTQEDRKNIRRELRELREQQKKEDKPEDLARMPRLQKKDLVPRANTLPAEEIILDSGFALQKGNIFTNGIDYLNLAFDLSGLPEDLQNCLPFFLRLFNKIGIGNLNYSTMADRMAANAMSLKMSADTGYAAAPATEGRGILILSMKVLADCFPAALELLDSQWHSKSFQEDKRLQELLRQHWSQLRDEILQNSQYLATSRASLGLSSFAVLNDRLHGPRHVRASRTAAACSHDQFLRLQEQLEKLSAWLSAQYPCSASFSGNDQDLPILEQWLHNHSQGRHACRDFLSSAILEQPMENSLLRKEIIPLNNGGACCARIFSAPGIRESSSPALAVYSQLLSCGFLWEKIRMEGGAYGVNCQYHPFNGLLSFITSEDPHPLQSFKVFDSIPGLSAKKIWTARDIDSAIIACSKGDDRPWRPAQVTSAALLNKIYGYTEDMRQERRDALLSLQPSDLYRHIDAFWQNYAGLTNDCLVGPAYWSRHSTLTTVRL